MKFQGCPYPIVKHSRGLLYSQGGIDQIKSDLLILLLTNPGERVMLPDFGTPLRSLVFDQNDQVIAAQAREMIANSIATWEKRITIQSIDVNYAQTDLDYEQTTQNQMDNLLGIRILFFDPGNINEVQELVLEVPLAGG